MMKRPTTLVTVLLAAAAGMLMLSACAAPISAQSPQNGAQPRTISVTGNGVAYGSPDVATIQVGVQTRNVDAAQAVSANSDRTAALIAAIKAMGVAERDIQTTNFSVYAQQDYDPITGLPKEVINYVVDNTVSLTVRDLDSLGDVLSGVVDAGANNIHGISFSVADRAALEGDARELAVADARERAEQLARVAGVTLDAPLTITEYATYNGNPVFGREMAMAADMAAVPVETGQIGVSLQVNITYLIR